MQKRRDLFQYLRTKKYNIVCLQDVHIESKMESYVRSEWGFSNLYLSSLSGNCRGVMILINNNFDCEVKRVLTDTNGNYVIIDMKIQDHSITLASIYGPNEDKPQFYRDLKQKLLDFNNEKIIICGDWNIIINPELDSENYKHINNPKARDVVLSFVEEDNYIDVWRMLNENKKGFTWRRINPDRKQARLDYFLLKEDILHFIHDSSIVPGYRTDHSGIILSLKFNDNERGKGFWKFNNSLLKDTNYIQVVKNTINEVINTYKKEDEHDSETNNNQNNNDNNNNTNNTTNNNRNENSIEFDINDQLLLETMLLIIRGETIKYSSRKKKEKTELEKQLEKDIFQMEKNITENLNDFNIEDLNNLEEKKTRLYELRKNTIEGVMLRSKCRYENLGEKATSYFFNLEKRNYTNKVIVKLIEENGKEWTATSDILEGQKRYYKTLYAEKINIDDTPIDEIIGENPNKLSDIEAEKLEGEITYLELATALKNMKNSKTPGNDGFTAEFFKFFWPDLGIYILRSLNFAYKTGSLSVTQKQGVITCLPKPNKSPFYLKNWRPISLLNVIYKLASSVLASRIKTSLDKIIHEDQKGFLPGRFLGENIRLIYDILFETKQQEIPGLILSVDFQQAFDTISWKFIQKTLDYYNFGPSFKKWIRIFQNGAESCILQNGYLSGFFGLQRGCRQGDPISPYIFILCAEVLGYMIRKDNSIHGIVVNNNEFKLSQYADDTQIFLDGTEDSLQNTLNVLQTFYLMSGLKINADKTKAIWIGSMNRSNVRLCHEYQLDWEQQPFKILGVTFTPEVFDIWDHNSVEIVKKIKLILNAWSKRKITLIGRVTVIKSLALSKFVHLFLALPEPPVELIKTLNKLLFNFLWHSGPDRISRKNIIKDFEKGGIRMIQVESFIKALKITWLRRIIMQNRLNSCTWNVLSNLEYNKIFSLGDRYCTVKAQDIQNPFWSNLLQSWGTFCRSATIDNIEQVLYSPLWYSSHISQRQNIYFRQWYGKGIRNIIDLVNENGQFYQFEDLQQQYGLLGTYLDYQYILRKIPDDWKNQINTNQEKCQQLRFQVSSNTYVKLLIKDKKGCRTFYNILTKNQEASSPPNKWINELGNITNEEWNCYNQFLKTLKEIKLRDFQFKINNRILVTKSFLYKINKIDNDRCSFCHQDRETISHLFANCPKVNEFWNFLKEWLEGQFNITIQLHTKHLLFPVKEEINLVNYFILVAKYYIYRAKFSSERLNIQNFISFLKRKFSNEMYISKINQTFDKFRAKWMHTYTYFAS